jgi:hypothetical protein
VVPGGVGYHDDYQVAGYDYPRMRMQPDDRIRSVIIIFEMKPMSFALGRKLPGPGVFGANSPDSKAAMLPCGHPRGSGLIKRTVEVVNVQPHSPFRLSLGPG